MEEYTIIHGMDMNTKIAGFREDFFDGPIFWVDMVVLFFILSVVALLSNRK